MILKPASRVAGFLRAPDPSCRLVLVYGPDGGLVRERGEALARTVVPDLSDAFHVTELTGAAASLDPARLPDEAASLSLLGGRRVVRVRDATDAVAGPVGAVLSLAAAAAFVVVEAGDLPSRSALRKLCEASPLAVAIPCYLDGPREVAALIRETLAAERIVIEGDAVEYLVERLGLDRALTRMELEKLVLHAGPGGRVGVEAARAVIGDTGAVTLEDAVFAAGEGDPAATERALSRAFADGQAPVPALRAALRHFHRLHLAGAAVARGVSPEEAVAALRPPVFFKHKDAFTRQLRRWPPARCALALDRLNAAERAVKRTGAPAELLARETFLALARAR